MKAFEIHLKSDGSVVYAERPSQWAGFRNFLIQINTCGDADKIRIFVKGKEVDLDTAVDLAEEQGDLAYEKKCETHKQVWVRQGICNFKSNYHQVWVRK